LGNCAYVARGIDAPGSGGVTYCLRALSLDP